MERGLTWLARSLARALHPHPLLEHTCSRLTIAALTFILLIRLFTVSFASSDIIDIQCTSFANLPGHFHFNGDQATVRTDIACIFLTYYFHLAGPAPRRKAEEHPHPVHFGDHLPNFGGLTKLCNTPDPCRSSPLTIPKIPWY